MAFVEGINELKTAGLRTQSRLGACAYHSSEKLTQKRRGLQTGRFLSSLCSKYVLLAHSSRNLPFLRHE
jgi:hypothetical protein